jgi:hypothetical protein
METSRHPRRRHMTDKNCRYDASALAAGTIMPQGLGLVDKVGAVATRGILAARQEKFAGNTPVLPRSSTKLPAKKPVSLRVAVKLPDWCVEDFDQQRGNIHFVNEASLPRSLS